MANKTNKYVGEIRNLIRMIENGMLDIDSQDMIIERVEDLFEKRKINKTEREMLTRALRKN